MTRDLEKLPISARSGAELIGLAAGLFALVFFAVPAAHAVEPLTDATMIAAGGSHSCAVASGHQVQCWGHNWIGQTGIGRTKLEHRFALPVRGLENDTVTGLALGFEHSCALLSGGNVKCWGSNWYGGAGAPGGGPSGFGRAMQVPGLESGIVKIASSYEHSCALTNGGGLKCWGDNSVGQLGRGVYGLAPGGAADVVGLTSGVVDVATNERSSCAVTSTGGVKCWGFRTSGQNDSAVPLDKPGISGALKIAGGGFEFCVLMSGNAIKCWNVNDESIGVPPRDVAGLPADITKLVMGNGHQCVLTAAGTAHCWGLNGSGQLGDGTQENRLTPVAVAPPAGNLSDISAGRNHACGVTAEGAALCWGNNTRGKLGNDGNEALVTLPGTVFRGLPLPPLARSDFNVDGRSDIFWHNALTGTLYEMQMNGLTPSASGVIDQKGVPAWKVVAGLPGPFDSGVNVIWYNQVTGEVYGVTMNGLAKSSERTVYVEPNTNWKIVGSGDLAGDGYTALLWRNVVTGDVYVMNLNGLHVTGGALIYSEPNLNWQVQQLADFNGDGVSDVLWRNTATGDVFMMLMNGATVAGGGVIYSEPNTAWQIQAAADFNGDGRADVLWRNTTTGDVFMMQMNGTTITGGSVIYSEPNADWKIVATGDYDGDGRADILWRNASSGQVFMMLMDGFAITSGGFVYTEPDQNWKILGP